jgi:NAD(P)-dependent dehydrogenase (short-subunit alcohol dehydrogenase family)
MTREVVVVTGAAGALGSAVARAFAVDGASLALLDRVEAKLDLGGAAALSSAVDLTDEAAVADAARRVERELGAPTALVCVAGGYAGDAPVATTGWDAYERMLAINLRTAQAAVCAFVPGMQARGRGSVCFVASTAGEQAFAGAAAYAGAKAALLRLAEALALEQRDHGVRVNSVLPGTMDTPANRSWMDEAAIARAVDPAAVAEVIVFLASARARAVHGATVRVTGRQ